MSIFDSHADYERKTKLHMARIDPDKVTIARLLESPELAKHMGWCFYDFFCPTKQLERRYRQALPKVKFLVKEGLIDAEKCYLSIKNCDDDQFCTTDAIRIHQMREADETDEESAFYQSDVIMVIYSGNRRIYRSEGWGQDEIVQDDAEITLFSPQGYTSQFDEFDLRTNSGVFKADIWSDLKKRIKKDEVVRKVIKSHCVDFTNTRELNEQRMYQYGLKAYCDFRNKLLSEGYSECTPCNVIFCPYPWRKEWNKDSWQEDKWVDHVA